MKWLKQVILDLVITVLILVATILNPVWAMWIVVVYTPIMLLMKVFSVFGTGITAKIKQTDAAVPTWFWHSLYAVNTVALLFAGWWITGTQWALIWILSIVAEARTRARKKAKKGTRKKP